MRGISKLAVAGAICACAAALAAPVSHAQPVAGAAKIIRPIKVVKSDQASILKRGLLLRLRHSRKYSLKVTSATFDSADGLLAKRRKVSVGSRGDRVVRLKLTGEGRRELSACAARTITVRSGKRRATTELVRNTAACGPKPVDLSRAAECDCIGQQAGSRCLLPFPSDFHTVADPSSSTGGGSASRRARCPAT